MPGPTDLLLSPTSSVDATPSSPGVLKQPRRVNQSIKSTTQSVLTVGGDSGSTNISTQSISPGLVPANPARDVEEQSHLSEDRSRPQPITHSPETIHRNLESTTSSDILDTGLTQAKRTVTTVTGTTTQIQERQNIDVQHVQQPAVVKGQPRRDLSDPFQGALQMKPSLDLARARQSSVSTISPSAHVETRRFPVPSKSSSFIVENSLVEIQQLHRQETDHIIAIMKARLKEHEEYKVVFEQQYEVLRVDYEMLLRQLSEANSQITVLKIQLSSYGDSRPKESSEIPDSAITTITNTVTITITTVITRIEQWKDEVIRNKGQITISGTELERMLAELADAFSRMTKLQQDCTELLKERGSIRRQLQMEMSLGAQKDTTIASLTAQAAQWENADSAKAQQIVIFRRDNGRLQEEISIASSRAADLERKNDKLSAELNSAHDELQVRASLIKEGDDTIASLTADLTLLRQSGVDRENQIAILRQEYEKLEKESSSQKVELQRRYNEKVEELDSARKELQDHKTLVEEKERIITSLNAEIEKLKGVNATVSGQLDAERREKEKLQADISAFRSDITHLQERCRAQEEELVSLRNDLRTKEALLLEQEHTITDLTDKLQQVERESGLLRERIETARQEVEELRVTLSVVRDEKANIQKRFDALEIELKNLELGGSGGTTDVAVGIKKEIEKLRGDLVAAASRHRELEKAHEARSKEVSDLRDELKVKASQYMGAMENIDSLNMQIQQFKATVAEQKEQLTTNLNAIRELEVKVTTISAQLAELHDSYVAQTKQLNSVGKELQDMTLSNQEKDHEISTLTAERNQLLSAGAEKAEQISKLQQELSISMSQITELRDRRQELSDKLDSVSSKLQAALKSIEDKDHKIVTFTSEITELRRTNASIIETTHQQVEVLKLELTNARSQITTLEHDNELLSTQLDSLKRQREAMVLGKDETISSLKAEVAKWERMCSDKGKELTVVRENFDRLCHEQETLSSRLDKSQQELIAAQKDLEQLHHERDASSSRITELQQELASKSGDWEQLSATKAEELSKARAELERLRREVSILQSQIVEYQEKYAAQLAELNSQIEQWKRSHATKEKELTIARGSVEQLQRDKDELSSQFNDQRHRCETHSAELDFLQKQLSVIPPDADGDSEVSIEAWKTKIMAEMKDYATVIRLTTTVDKWLHEDAERAKVLAAELEKRNKENEELRHKLITLKEIYIHAPRIKCIFESETIEVKRRHTEELNALRSALAESQAQLRGVQRVVATADTYADEMIISALKKLNAEVQQNTTYMAEGIAADFRPRTTKATKEQASAMQNVAKSIGQTFTSSLANMDSDVVELYLSFAFQSYFSYCLRQIISSWTINAGHNEFIHAIYEQLERSETQPMSGRWRALTLAYISPTWMKNRDPLIDQIVAELSDVVVIACCATSAAAAKLKISSYRDKVSSIIITAGKFSEMIGKVVSADFAVIAPAPLQSFDGETMEDVDESGATRNQKVLCSTQLGMTKRMQQESEKKTLTVIKARVILQSFLDG